MSRADDLEPLSDSLAEMFGRLGLPNPTVMADLGSHWEELAAEPWRGRSRPVVVKGKTLVVEAASPSMVAFLKYGISDLVDRLAERFGEGVISSVEVVPPDRF